jgi:hypothetical protein
MSLHDIDTFYVCLTMIHEIRRIEEKTNMTIKKKEAFFALNLSNTLRQ